MEKANPRRNLIALLQNGAFIDVNSNPEWKKAPDKIKTSLILEEAARAIARKKIEIQDMSEENNKLVFSFEKLQSQLNKRTDKNTLLSKKKSDLEVQLKVLQDENTKSLNAKDEELKEIIEKNQQIKEEIEKVAKQGEEELKRTEERIHYLMKLADAALLQTREEKEARLKYQRSVSTLFHLEGELQRMQLISEKQSKKLAILMQLLETSRDHLKKSIEQKSHLLTQTQDAAEKMRKLCEQTLQEEQEFYNERDFDTMHTPPFINVKRRPRD